MNRPEKISDIKAYQKPQDSIFSTLFTRKLSAVFSFYLLRWFPGITPSGVTLLSFAFGILACALFFFLEYSYRILGVVLLQISFALDCSDGEIARYKNMASPFGAWLDSVLDRFKEAMMFAALAFQAASPVAFQNSWFTGETKEPGILLNMFEILVLGIGTVFLWQMIAYLREAKKSSFGSSRQAEFFITKNIYIGTVDVIIYLVCFGILFRIEELVLIFFFLAGIPLLLKQFLSAYRAGKVNESRV